MVYPKQSVKKSGCYAKKHTNTPRLAKKSHTVEES